MFLSEQLLEIGRLSNPKSNASMNEAAYKILDKIHEKQIGVVAKDTMLKYVFNQLSKEGYTYFGNVVDQFAHKGLKR
jgi:DNA-binding winged helix-turn-helix (wHTH) protein